MKLRQSLNTVYKIDNIAKIMLINDSIVLSIYHKSKEKIFVKKLFSGTYLTTELNFKNRGEILLQDMKKYSIYLFFLKIIFHSPF